MLFSFESIDNATLTNVQIDAFFFKSNLAKFLKKIFSNLCFGQGGFFWVILPGIYPKSTLAKFAK